MHAFERSERLLHIDRKCFKVWIKLEDREICSVFCLIALLSYKTSVGMDDPGHKKTEKEINEEKVGMVAGEENWWQRNQSGP